MKKMKSYQPHSLPGQHPNKPQQQHQRAISPPWNQKVDAHSRISAMESEARQYPLLSARSRAYATEAEAMQHSSAASHSRISAEDVQAMQYTLHPYIPHPERVKER